MKKIMIMMTAVVAVIGFSSCSKDNSAGTANIPQVSSLLTATNRSAMVNSISKDSLVWTSAKAQVTVVKFEAKKAGSEIEFKSAGQQAIDLFSSSPIAGNLDIPAGTYDEVELKTNLQPLAGQPSLELKANLTINGQSIPVIFSSVEAIEVKGEKKNITIDPGASYNVSTLIDLSLVITGISATDLSNAQRVNGGIVISGSVNTDLYKRIMNNLNNLEEECEVHHH